MESISIFLIIFLTSLIVLTVIKLFKEIEYIKKEKERSKEIFDMFSEKNTNKK